jgi:hypothetical protein
MTADVKRRLLVVANHTVESDTIGPHLDGDTDVLVIAPALNTRLNSLAIEDALQLFAADRIVISTPSDGRSNWLARGLVERARDRFTALVEPAPGAL